MNEHAGLDDLLSQLTPERRLSADEEVRLFTALRDRLAGGFQPEADAIRNGLLTVYLKLVASVARRFMSREFPPDELLSEGYVTLITAIDRFDVSRGFRFSTYATNALVHNLRRFVMRRQRERSRHLELSDTLGLASDLGQRLVAERRAAQVYDRLGGWLDQLGQRESFVIRLRFGLGAELDPQTLQTVADHLGVTRERVRQVESKALAKLRRLAEAEPFELLA